jgi:hypothetical protein
MREQQERPATSLHRLEKRRVCSEADSFPYQPTKTDYPLDLGMLGQDSRDRLPSLDLIERLERCRVQVKPLKSVAEVVARYRQKRGKLRTYPACASGSASL